MTLATHKPFTFPDAFMLMWYACKCGHRERVWNSRDGITPFGMDCPSCGDFLNHVNWGDDVAAPNHTLLPRQKFWRDGTPDEAEAIMRKRIAQMQDEYPTSDEEAAEIIKACRDGTASEFQKGWPMLDAAP